MDDADKWKGEGVESSTPGGYRKERQEHWRNGYWGRWIQEICPLIFLGATKNKIKGAEFDDSVFHNKHLHCTRSSEKTVFEVSPVVLHSLR